MISDNRFLADGRKRALLGLQAEAEALRIKIKQEIEAQFAPQLAASGKIKRWYLYVAMQQELKRRLAQVVAEIESRAPQDALY
jgi:hypothetical protein